MRALLEGRRGQACRSSLRASPPRPTSSTSAAARPWASINFITAHDGFTLNDLVSYNDKHNEANGEDNRDGHSHNLSRNHGVEGPTDDPEIEGVRLRQMRNMLATLLFSRGTPMILAGDEFARTQDGNNNAYCQDNEVSWVNWDRIPTIKGAHLVRADADRDQAGSADAAPGPAPHRRVRRGNRGQGRDLAHARGRGDDARALGGSQCRCVGVLLDGRAQETGIRRIGTDSTLLQILNAHNDVVRSDCRKPSGAPNGCG